MTFRHLEERIVQEQREMDYFDLFTEPKLREPTRTVFGYTLDIAELLHTSRLKNQYLLFGGYAVLTHLLSILGERAVLAWRGSEDIDMYGTERVVQTLKGHYAVATDWKSPNVDNKRTIKLKTNDDAPEPEVKIDFAMNKGSYIPTERKIFGIPITVATPVSLIRSKAPFAAVEQVDAESRKHKVDIVNLLWVAEHDHISPQEVYGIMIPDEKRSLQKAIRNSLALVSNERTSLAPTKDYITAIGEGINYLK